jgi:hypothetical protein
MSDSERKRLFGLEPKDKWPAEGMPVRSIGGGWVVWVRPLVGGPERDFSGRVWRRMRHRCMARCPHCEREFSAGRIGQHKCWAMGQEPK